MQNSHSDSEGLSQKDKELLERVLSAIGNSGGIPTNRSLAKELGISPMTVAHLIKRSPEASAKIDEAIKTRIQTIPEKLFLTNLQVPNISDSIRASIDKRLTQIIIKTIKKSKTISSINSIAKELEINYSVISHLQECSPNASAKIEDAIKARIQTIPEKLFLTNLQVPNISDSIRASIDKRLTQIIIKTIKKSKTIPSINSAGRELGISPTTIFNLKERLPETSTKINEAIKTRVQTMPQELLLSNLTMPAITNSTRTLIDKRLIQIITNEIKNSDSLPTVNFLAKKLKISCQTILHLKERFPEASTKIDNAIKTRIQTMSQKEFLSNLIRASNIPNSTRAIIDERLTRIIIDMIQNSKAISTLNSMADELGISRTSIKTSERIEDAINTRIQTIPQKEFLSTLTRTSRVLKSTRIYIDERLTHIITATIENSKTVPSSASIGKELNLSPPVIIRLKERSQEASTQIEEAIKTRIQTMPQETFLQNFHMSDISDSTRTSIDKRLTQIIIKTIENSKGIPTFNAIAKELGISFHTIPRLKKRSPKASAEIDNAMKQKSFQLRKTPKTQTSIDAFALLELFSQGFSDQELADRLGEKMETVIYSRRQMGIYRTGEQHRAGASLSGTPGERSKMLLEMNYTQLSPFRTVLSLLELLGENSAVYAPSPFPFLQLAVEFAGREIKLMQTPEEANTIFIQYPFNGSTIELGIAINSLPVGGQTILSVPRNCEIEPERFLELVQKGFKPSIMLVNSSSEEGGKVGRKLTQQDTFIILEKTSEQSFLFEAPMPFAVKERGQINTGSREGAQKETEAPHEAIRAILRQTIPVKLDIDYIEDACQKQFDKNPIKQKRSFAGRILKSPEIEFAKEALVYLNPAEASPVLEIGSSIRQFFHRILPSLNIAELAAEPAQRRNILDADSISDAPLFKGEFAGAVSIMGWDALDAQGRQFLLTNANSALQEEGSFVLVSSKTPEFDFAKFGFEVEKSTQKEGRTITVLKKTAQASESRLQIDERKNLCEKLRIMKFCLGVKTDAKNAPKSIQKH